MNSETNGQKASGRSLTGFMASLVIETPLAKHLSFQPHIAYVRKGMQVKTELFTGSDTLINLRYVDLPMNLVYTAGTKLTFYAGAGPVLSFNLPSQRVVKVGDTKSNTELSFGKEANNNYRGFDYGANILVGLRLPSGLFMSLNYTQGFRNLMPIENGNDKINNNYVGLQLGFLFKNNDK